MTDKINDGGPAFPMPGMTGLPNDGFTYGEPGMTLRDWFAGKELAKTIGTSILDEAVMYERLAIHCYRMADAMLAAREPAPEQDPDLLVTLTEIDKRLRESMRLGLSAEEAYDSFFQLVVSTAIGKAAGAQS